MAKYRKVMPEIEAISVTEILFCFKHNFQSLPNWVKEAYEKMDINTITDDSFFVRLAGMTVVANQDDCLLYNLNNKELWICNKEDFEQKYEKVGE